MPVLHLENVPEKVYRELERLAQRDRQTPESKALSLLEEGIRQEGVPPRENVRQVLERIRSNPLVPTPGTPDSVELLREDRNR